MHQLRYNNHHNEEYLFHYRLLHFLRSAFISSCFCCSVPSRIHFFTGLKLSSSFIPLVYFNEPSFVRCIRISVKLTPFMYRYCVPLVSFQIDVLNIFLPLAHKPFHRLHVLLLVKLLINGIAKIYQQNPVQYQ